MEFSKIEVITSMNKVQDLKAALSKLGVSGITVAQVIGCGVEKGTFEFEVERNAEMELLPKQMIMIIIENEKVHDVVELVKKELYTGIECNPCQNRRRGTGCTEIRVRKSGFRFGDDGYE